MSETSVNVTPVWARIAVVQGITGVPDNVLRRLYNSGVVRARKIDPLKVKSACVFRVADVLEWLENEAAKPEKFKLPEATNG